MEFMQSLTLSMDACYLDRDKSDMTPEQNYNATYLLTRLEVAQLVKEFKAIDKRTLRKKQRSFYQYFEPVNKWLEGFPNTLEGEEEELVHFFEGLVKLVSDAHRILHEDTNQQKREWIIKGAEVYYETDEEGEA
jgi:hypothetical protein|tara:strand:- start:150 stop:551 length:402 start_codon:yes stop_codon:yes gene_type:complete